MADTSRAWLRERRVQLGGMTQAELAKKVGVKERTVHRWEVGASVPTLANQFDLALALELDYAELRQRFSGLSHQEDDMARELRRRQFIETAGMATAHAALTLRRRDFLLSGDLEHIPESTHARALQDDIALMNRWYQAAQYDAVVRALPTLQASISEAVGLGRSEDQQLLRAQCHGALIAAKVLNKQGKSLEAYAAASSALSLAEAVQDPFGRAAAEYQVASAYLRTGRQEEAEQLAVDSAERLRDTTPEGITWRGALTLLSSVVAGRRKDFTAMRRRLDQASALAATLGRDDNIGWTAFGPTNVQIHRVSAAIESEDYRLALDEAQRLDIEIIPGPLHGRRALVHIESARAHIYRGDMAVSALHLIEAERIGAEVLGNSKTGLETMALLMRCENPNRMPGLRALAERFGVHT